MKIIKTKFITSFADAKEYAKFDYKNEFCFCGRSNVGKSTLINTLTNQKIAKTSQTPGRTRLINIFDCNDGQFTLVDLPGYGYAKASKTQNEAFKTLAEGYFSAATSKNALRKVFILCDIRVKSPLDSQMLDYLYYFQLPFSILATKCDKLSKSQLHRHVMDLAAFLNVGKDNIITVSDKGMGKDKTLQMISEAINL
ncbi:MAG: ribosome biogenesis GTP-binding protein YihA/YsxC [Firmicutes bacterium]|nr:ribosome biogenesis GTP-binding protein YihA/YsxC [Bacillota bacterium]